MYLIFTAPIYNQSLIKYGIVSSNFIRKYSPTSFLKNYKVKGSVLLPLRFGENTNSIRLKIKAQEKKRNLKAYEWRSKAISEKLEKEEAAYVITEINNNLNNSSGYLGAISDRSKELYFNKETVGQYLYRQLKRNPHTPLSNQVFYRQDYLDEFEAIWKEQSKHHLELTGELKTEIRDIIIFYQRKLKSQKNLISLCEFENREIELDKNGSKTKKTVGLKVAPKSSPLFQEFKIWQALSNLLAKKKGSRKRTVSKAVDRKRSI
jgi:CRISPR-associated endonuclease Csn1